MCSGGDPVLTQACVYSTTPVPSVTSTTSTAPSSAQPASPTTTAKSAKKVSGPFSVGINSEETKTLQEMLSQDKEIYPEATVTGYYGTLTVKAVQRFQCKYNIVCGGSPDSTGYGLAGPATRAKINEVFASDEAFMESLRKQILELQKMVADLTAQLQALLRN